MTRTRRDPEEARRLILEAAQRALLKRGPDAVRLKDVAEEAGVSRALVSHYFGKIHEVIEAAFESHIDRQRERFLTRFIGARNDPREWFDAFFEEALEPLHSRLVAWSMISGRAEAEDFFPVRRRGTKLVVDAIEARFKADGKPRSREELEVNLVIAVSATMGYSLARKVLWSAVGRRASKERDAKVRARLADMLLRDLETDE